ncbi:TPA: hypothetical protein JAJ32_000896 [Legionella pneumophila]|nr:hypothetical protein LPE509_00846 [Legionella pneumophila subsp. pneumophila LPE509]CZG54462.1 Uncharacterised protein [Legionella pneumophila]CZG71601.1 Uncharacterised protein [Legionella pneumophila]CZG73638.1 Uncharacterised protein [Legionella pneumophila]CZG83161.1 Uncharacterised protein [Legionella pneumophila]
MANTRTSRFFYKLDFFEGLHAPFRNRTGLTKNSKVEAKNVFNEGA